MTRVIASLAELGFVARDAHPADGRQVLVSVSRTGTELIEAERRASQEWLKQRLDRLQPDQRNTLLVASDLMSGIVDEARERRPALGVPPACGGERSERGIGSSNRRRRSC
jgi:DNA-binding MarR family transcriptional regulator